MLSIVCIPLIATFFLFFLYTFVVDLVKDLPFEASYTYENIVWEIEKQSLNKPNAIKIHELKTVGYKLRHAIKDYYSHPDKPEKKGEAPHALPEVPTRSLVREKKIPIDSIVTKFISAGMTFQDAEYVLQSAGFKLLPRPPRIKIDNDYEDVKFSKFQFKTDPINYSLYLSFNHVPRGQTTDHDYSLPLLTHITPFPYVEDYALFETNLINENAMVGELSLWTEFPFFIGIFRTEKAVIVLYPEKYGTFDTNVASVFAALYYRQAICC